jgi:hypothetical protein
VLYQPSSPSKLTVTLLFPDSTLRTLSMFTLIGPLLTKHLDVLSVGLKGTIADYVPCVTLPVAPSNELFMDGV